MKYSFYTLLLLLLCCNGYSQKEPTLNKTWIKQRAENLSDNEVGPDTSYARYTFTKSGDLKISFYPAWDDDYKYTYSKNGDNLTLIFDTYKIETLTDSTLSIALNGFRRFVFLAEEYGARKPESKEVIGEWKASPLYKGNSYITPRYKKEKLWDAVRKNLDAYHGREAATFLATFIVTDKGEVENVQIVNAVSEGHSNAFVKQILKTSKQWEPATVNGQAVHTQMSFEIRYMKSLLPYSSGRMN